MYFDACCFLRLHNILFFSQQCNDLSQSDDMFGQRYSFNSTPENAFRQTHSLGSIIYQPAHPMDFSTSMSVGHGQSKVIHTQTLLGITFGRII